jgi:hypothetical protein
MRGSGHAATAEEPSTHPAITQGHCGVSNRLLIAPNILLPVDGGFAAAEQTERLVLDRRRKLTHQWTVVNTDMVCPVSWTSRRGGDIPPWIDHGGRWPAVLPARQSAHRLRMTGLGQA